MVALTQMNQGWCSLTTDQQRKDEVLKYVDRLRTAGVTKVTVSYYGDGDEGLVGRLLMVDLKAMRFETLSYGWDETNPLSGTKRR